MRKRKREKEKRGWGFFILVFFMHFILEPRNQVTRRYEKATVNNNKLSTYSVHNWR
jgi:hypothetical protein